VKNKSDNDMKRAQRIKTGMITLLFFCIQVDNSSSGYQDYLYYWFRVGGLVVKPPTRHTSFEFQNYPYKTTHIKTFTTPNTQLNNHGNSAITGIGNTTWKAIRN
jgi:hypothetical protein